MENLSHLTNEMVGINKRGKPTGKTVELYNKFGLVTGSKLDRIEPGRQSLETLENLICENYHFVLQASEGDGIKVVDNNGMSKCILIFRSGGIHSFNLKASRETVLQVIKDVEIPATMVNIRGHSKSDSVYTDFEKDLSPMKIVEFIYNLPQSSNCHCGHKNDIQKAIKIVKAA